MNNKKASFTLKEAEKQGFSETFFHTRQKKVIKIYNTFTGLD